LQALGNECHRLVMKNVTLKGFYEKGMKRKEQGKDTYEGGD